jgi:hypothetical protein
MRAILLGVMLALPAFTRAADVPVRYLVNDTSLKTAVAGTNLTFTLYTDSACTSPPAATSAVPVENVNVISRLKVFKAKSAPTVPPKTDELSYTLTGVTASGNLYLKVTGTGVTPVGAACQAQASAVQLPSGYAVALFDSNEKLMGPYDLGASAVLLPLSSGSVTALTVDGSGFGNGFGQLYFTSNDCSGQALSIVQSGSLTVASNYRGSNNTLYFPAASGGSNVTSNSSLQWAFTLASCTSFGFPFVPPDSCCVPQTVTTTMAPPTTMDMSGFVPPFHLGHN